MSSEIEKLTKRIEDLESKMGKSAKPKRTRKPSEFNKFLANYIDKNKSENKPHTELFKEAAAAWGKQKEEKAEK